jgi:uncharacterized membrane protein YecN with MAPEG domain
MPHPFRRLRRFRFNLPQRIAAALLVLFLAQAAWLISRLAAPAQLLPRLPFLAVGVLLGGALWWVTRRLYGNQGGYTALVFYCFSPAILRACVLPGSELLAVLGVYGGVYTSVGVAHAMQGPRRKWRPRILLLTAIFAIAVLTHLVALAVALLLGLALVLWIAEGRRSQVSFVLLTAVAGALAVLFACDGFSLRTFWGAADAFSFTFSLDPARRFFFALPHVGIGLATAAALLLYLAQRRSRYFGNTAPLLCASALFLLVTKAAPATTLWLWALPFLLTFIGGVFADAYQSPRRRLALGAAGALILLQVAACLLSLPGLL